MDKYFYLSEKKSSKPITLKKNKKNSFLEIFNFNKKVKPIIKNKNYEYEFYEKYGIIYTGSDFDSCINSLL